jgi:hypothetical protein
MAFDGHGWAGAGEMGNSINRNVTTNRMVFPLIT